MWGSYFTKKQMMLSRLKVPATQGRFIRKFLYAFTKADNGIVLNLGWDKVRVAVPFTE
jgi:hypothetical protein